MEVRLHPLEFARRHLPFVCAITGEPAAWYAKVAVHRAINPAAFLLIFFGPIGWLILVFVAARPDGTYVEVPISQQVYEQIRERRRRLRWLAAGIVVATLLLFYLASGAPLLTTGLVFLPVIAMGFWVGSVTNHRVRISVDGVGLVTIKKCHPNFVAAVEQWRESDRAPTAQL